MTASSTEPIRVVIAGPDGQMGSALSDALPNQPGISVVGGVRRNDPDVSASLAGADVLLDFTHADVAPGLMLAAISAGVRPVSGTSGISESALDAVEKAAIARGIGAIWVPNFSLGAVLMGQMARLAARYMHAVEIIEGHPSRKADAPSGTALAIARDIRRVHGSDLVDEPVRTPLLDGIRGAVEGGVRVHSVRHPVKTMISWHEILFTAEDGVLTIRHDDAAGYVAVAEIANAIRVVMGPEIVGLVRGYASVLGLDG